MSAVQGKKITTLEGLGSVEHPHVLQKAFIEEQAAQCGFCMNGIIMNAKVMLDKNPHPTERRSSKGWPTCCAAAAAMLASSARFSERPGKGHRGADMKTTDRTTTISRRELLKGAGALVVSFSLWSPLSRALAQSANPTALLPAPLEPEATSLDSWLAVAADGDVTVFSSKVDLGTGVLTALSQIVAEELDVPFRAIHMETGDTSITIDQAATVGSATIERGGPQLRQAAAAARQELLKLAATHLNTPVEKLTVSDGVVSDGGSPAKTVSYAELVGGKRFNVKITATGAGGAMKVAPEVTRQGSEDVQDRRDLGSARGSAAEVHRRVHLYGGCARARHAAWPRGSASDGEHQACERGREFDCRHCGSRKSGAGGTFRRRGGADGVGRDPGGEKAESNLVGIREQISYHQG